MPRHRLAYRSTTLVPTLPRRPSARAEHRLRPPPLPLPSFVGRGTQVEKRTNDKANRESGRESRREGGGRRERPHLSLPPRSPSPRRPLIGILLLYTANSRYYRDDLVVAVVVVAVVAGTVVVRRIPGTLRLWGREKCGCPRLVCFQVSSFAVPAAARYPPHPLGRSPGPMLLLLLSLSRMLVARRPQGARASSVVL